MRITEEHWLDLENETYSSGLVTRRLYPDSHLDIHIAVEQTSGRRMLLLGVPQATAERAVRRHGALPVTRGLAMQFAPATVGYRNLQVVLTSDAGREVFNPLIADIAATAVAHDDPDTLVGAAIGRFEHWRRLLESVRENGLPPERRRGLYGELFLLRELVLPTLSATAAISCWTGPTGADQDFQLEHMALEVKTGRMKSPPTLDIASERQLDATGLDHLVLTHLWVEERRGGSGESLNRIVDDIRAHIEKAAIRYHFDDLLANAAFLDEQREQYDEPRYGVRGRTFWLVKGDFPRVIRTDLRDGVRDCRYQISVGKLDRYRVTEEEVVSIVKGPM
ncbi:PD-(D/E)XK motif protein [Actinoplanes xinjiangensis]|uniref:PD-(D/E)XK motif protein n=1 Tax=Actinoplanes xinjiangensis TaxID=512350 RepID=UPI003426F0C7